MYLLYSLEEEVSCPVYTTEYNFELIAHIAPRKRRHMQVSSPDLTRAMVHSSFHYFILLVFVASKTP
jgi:hypothetical protein